MEKEIMVTVYCLAYNHEKYIRDCLDGFVNQKVNFRFEVIVHDDASTDNTVQIIQEYAEKYPEIIKPILQKENQYSKGANIGQEFLYPNFRGKYIAICEGDDYWCDNSKLQKQVDFLEENEDYVACVHPTRVDNYMDGTSFELRAFDKDCTVNVVDVLSKHTPIFHTTSIFYRRKVYEDVPEMCNNNEMWWDYSKLVMLALYGKIFYINEVMSVYRTLTEGSWTLRTRGKKNRSLNLDFPKAMIKALRFADEYSSYQYHTILERSILEFEYQVWRAEPHLRLLLNQRIYKLNAIRIIKMVFRCIFSII